MNILRRIKLTKRNKDAHSKSLSEALVNAVGGFPIGYFMGILTIPLFLDWYREDPWVANIFLTIIFMIVSLVRSYTLRRMFEHFGPKENFYTLSIRLVKYIKSKRSKKK